jgi:hypothetical protein
LSGFPWPINGKPDNNLVSSYALYVTTEDFIFGSKLIWRELFFCGLFGDAFNASDYTTSNHRMIGQNYIGKDMEGNGRGRILRNFPGGTEESQEEP